MPMTDFFTTAPSTEDWSKYFNFEADSSLLANDNDSESSPASAALGLTPQAMSPAGSNMDTPKSTESEQSQSLDTSDLGALFGGFDFDLPAPNAGISHDPNDLLAVLAAQDAAQTTNTTYASSFNSTLSGHGLGGTSTQEQNDLTDILRQFTAASTASTVPAAPAPTYNAADVANAFSILDWPPSTPAFATTPSPLASLSMKRKLSETETEDAANKRARSSTPVAKRPYRRQSKNTLSLSQLAAAASSGSPLVTDRHEDVEAVKQEEAEVVAAVRLTSTGKPSTARPKAVVPEKYMKNGEAQTITGMSTEQILAYPNWDALMQDVDETHRSGAEIFGKMITENRDKAKWAAKKSRDERKQKVEQLEGQVDELQKKIEGMRNVMLGLVRKGALDITEVEKYI